MIGGGHDDDCFVCLHRIDHVTGDSCDQLVVVLVELNDMISWLDAV